MAKYIDQFNRIFSIHCRQFTIISFISAGEVDSGISNKERGVEESNDATGGPIQQPESMREDENDDEDENDKNDDEDENDEDDEDNVDHFDELNGTKDAEDEEKQQNDPFGRRRYWRRSSYRNRRLRSYTRRYRTRRTRNWGRK